MRRHSRRRRASGPAFALVVAVCQAHGAHFTLYPPGWAPYLRVSLVDAEPRTGRARSPAWRATLFAAAVCAAAGELWPEESVGAPACGRTQRRHLESCGRLLGLGDKRAWERTAARLGVPLSDLRNARQGWSRSRRRRPRGGAVAGVVAALVLDESSWRRLVQCGSDAGLWGTAWAIDERGVLGRVFPG